MFRFLLLIHRYLGIAIGLLVALWCSSAFVMMYVQFPELTDKELLAALPDIEQGNCCVRSLPVVTAMSKSTRFVIESLAESPVVRVMDARGTRRTFDLSSGDEISSVGRDLATRVAVSYFGKAGIAESAELIGNIERDQWTVAGYFDAMRPFYLFAADDQNATRVYVSAVSGQPVQDSNRSDRIWNWFGAVTHWIYPTVLRQNTALWSQVVIWTTAISMFLVGVGLYIGILQFRSRRSGRRPAYKGACLWHHYSGLIFGLLTMTWLTSGLVSMNPWGLFIADRGAREQQDIQDGSITTDDAAALLTSLSSTSLPIDTVRIRSALFAGEFAVLALRSDGTSIRLDGRTLLKRPLAEYAWQQLPTLIGAESRILDAGWLGQGDAYYFSHHEKAEFPVYRLVLDNADQTRYYFHPRSGELVKKVDSAARGYRWWFEALHRGDFAGLSRRRPLWDFIMLTLLTGVTVGAVTGVYIGFRRLIRQKR